MASPKQVSNQAFKLKKPERPCDGIKVLGPKIEDLDNRVAFLEGVVLARITDLTTRINNMADRCGRLT